MHQLRWLQQKFGHAASGWLIGSRRAEAGHSTHEGIKIKLHLSYLDFLIKSTAKFFILHSNGQGATLSAHQTGRHAWSQSCLPASCTGKRHTPLHTTFPADIEL
eukprot:365477-Chlamydomonas_euryale.AAC.5